MADLKHKIYILLNRVNMLRAQKAASSVEQKMAQRLGKIVDDISSRIVEEVKVRGVVIDKPAVLAPIRMAMEEFDDIMYEEIISSVDPTMPNAADLIESQIFAASRRTMDKMTKDISGVLDNALGSSMTPQELAQELEEYFVDMKQGELLRIAQTELASAQNLAQYKELQAVGIEYHQWITVDDDKVRSSHMELHGEIVKVGEPFSNGLRYPGDKSGPIEEWINCRCIAVPWIPPPDFIYSGGPFYE